MSMRRDAKAAAMTATISAEELQTRLERWEREKRHMLGLGVVILTICAAMAMHGGRWGRRAKVVEAETFLVRDQEGQVRARLSIQKDGSPELALLDKAGQHQFLIQGLADRSATLHLYDQGHVRIALSALSSGAASMNLYDRDRGAFTGIYMGSDRKMGLAFHDGNQEAHVNLTPDGTAGVRVSDGSGREIGRMAMVTSKSTAQRAPDPETRSAPSAVPAPPAAAATLSSRSRTGSLITPKAIAVEY
jgi:hypothetical protein